MHGPSPPSSTFKDLFRVLGLVLVGCTQRLDPFQIGRVEVSDLPSD